jgi:ABC-2 type transport system ATP-binding protein
VTPALTIDSLVVVRGGRRAVDGVSLELEPGDCLGVAGPNGAGKSSLLDAIAGAAGVNSGSIRVGGEQPRRGRLLPTIGYAPQQPVFYPKLTGGENLRLFGTLYELGPKLEPRIAELVSELQLEEWIDRPAGQYSGGIARRLHVALAILHRPALLLLDEPTVGLDPASRNALLGTVRRLAESGAAVVMTSQLLNDLELVARQVLILVEGRARLLEETEVLLARAGGAVVAVECVADSGGKIDLDGVPGVLHWEVAEGVVRARVSQAPEALAAVLDRLREGGHQPARIEVLPPTLEEFLLERGEVAR